MLHATFHIETHRGGESIPFTDLRVFCPRVGTVRHHG